MFSKKLLIPIVLVFIILLSSGCTEDKNGNGAITSDNNTSDLNLANSTLESMVIVDNLPEGYEILATLPISNYNTFSEKIISSREGAYRDSDNFDVYLDIIELDSESSAVEFISTYKSQYDTSSIMDRFITEPFNGHDATRIKTYTLMDGTQLPKYQLIWNNDNFVFIVRSNSNLEDSALELAKATGY